jgi:hypothetical protein
MNAFVLETVALPLQPSVLFIDEDVPLLLGHQI